MDSELCDIEDTIQEMKRRVYFPAPPDGASAPCWTTKKKQLRGPLGDSLWEVVHHPVAGVDATTPMPAMQSRSHPPLTDYYPPTSSLPHWGHTEAQ